MERVKKEVTVMVETMGDRCCDMEEAPKVSCSSVNCSFCETELSTLKTRFICRTCQPDDKDQYLCQFCVVMHVRKSHQVTDQNNALVEVCEKDKNVAIFLCKTCDLKMFCYTCFKDHSGHDFAELSECNNEMKQIVGRVHESLSRFDAIYKRAAKCADIAKTTERRLSDVCDVYDSDYIKKDLERICIEALNERVIADNVATNRKTLVEKTEHVELLNNAVKEVGDSQMELRSMLSSSLMRIIRRHSDGDLTNLESKQIKPNILAVPKVTDRDVEDYRKNLDEKRAFLIEQLRPLVLEYVGNFKFSKVESLEVDLHDLTDEFNLLKLPLECAEVRIAGTKFGLLLACRVGDQFSVYRVSEPAKDAQFLEHVPAKHLWLSGVGKYECIALYPHNKSLHPKVHCLLNGKNNFHILQRPVNRSQLVGLFHFRFGLIPLVMTGSKGSWKLNMRCCDESFLEKPYSYDSIGLHGYWICHIFISGGQMFLYFESENYDDSLDDDSDEDYSLTGLAQLKVPCCENGDEHHGKFGCGFLEDQLRPTHLLVGMWCLQCKVFEVWGANKKHFLEFEDNTPRFVRELRVSLPVLDMKQVAFFGKKCFAVSNNNTVQYCENIYNIL